MPRQTTSSEQGVIVVLALMVISAFAVVSLATVSILAQAGFAQTNGLLATETTYAAAETGVNEALYRLLSNPALTGFDLTVGSVSVHVVIDRQGVDRLITSSAVDTTQKKRTLRVTAKTTNFGGGFSSAIQAGDAGIVMENNSWISGDVFSNGDIIGSGTNCGNNETIKNGNAWVAKTHALREITVQRVGTKGGAAYADFVPGSCVDVLPVRPAPDPLPPPILDSDIQAWKDEISGVAPFVPNLNVPLGPSAPGVCPTGYDDGSYYCIMNATTLGLQKINANLYIKGDVNVLLTRNIWVTGKIVIENAGAGKMIVQTSPSGGSVVAIADGTIDVPPNYEFCPTLPTPTCDPKSFILLLSTSDHFWTSISDPSAIYASNGSTSLILAAPYGEVRVKNGGTVNASAAEKVHLEQTSSVVYNSNLASFIVVAGSGQSIAPTPASWHEVMGVLP